MAAKDEPPKPPYFLVFEASGESPGSPLAIAADDRGAVPLFGSAERAREFLLSTDFGAGWEPAEVSTRRLVEVLEAHRDLVEYVAHDPPPAGAGGMKLRLGRLDELTEALRERLQSGPDLFDLGGPSEN